MRNIIVVQQGPPLNMTLGYFYMDKQQTNKIVAALVGKDANPERKINSAVATALMANTPPSNTTTSRIAEALMGDNSINNK